MVKWPDLSGRRTPVDPEANGGGVSVDPSLLHLEALERDLGQASSAPSAARALKALREHIEGALVARQALDADLERLRESEERWRSIATNPFDFVTIVDTNAVFLYVNRTAPGVSEADLIGKASIYDWTAPEYHASIRSALELTLRTAEPSYYEAYSPQVGAWYGSVVGPVVRDDRVVALSVQARDITKHKKAELGLRDSEERFRQLAENIEDVFFLIEPTSGRVLYTSPTYEKLWGRSLPEIYGNMAAWLEGLHPDDRPKIQARYASMLATCRGESTEFSFGSSLAMRIVRPDGSVRHARARLFPVRDAWGRVQRVAGVVSDLTERVEAEMKLAEAEARFRTLVEKLPVISYITARDDPGKALYISPQIEAKLGYPLQEWTQDPEFWLARVHPEDRERFLAAQRAFLDGSAPLRCRYRLMTRDGRELWFHDEAVLVPGGPGEPARIQGVLLDMTEAEEARAEQQRAREGASHLVGVQEMERRKIARELHDEIGQALTGLNFLLQSVHECPGESASVVQEARSLVGELMERVRNLSLELRPSMLDDLGLLATLLWMFERFEKQTRVQVSFEHRGLDVRFDCELETAAYRIVQEALTNVARHAGVREVDVRASCDGSILDLRIEDAGCGFEAGCRPRNGHGSGLAGMRERVTLLGGEFLLDSQSGRGTYISVRLPVVGRLRPEAVNPGGEGS